MNKKGVEITSSTLIVIILTLLVLVILTLTFTGGTAQLTQKIKEIFYRPAVSSEDVAVEQCRALCSTESKIAFCKKIKIIGKEQEQNCPDLGVSCPGITCS
ncbi:MAG: hypothetical protein AABX59_00655 [Nanoarchaeota archaeon]